MKRSYLNREQQAQKVMECRTSGLSDYQWCRQQNIPASTFYTWVTRLRKVGYTFPNEMSKEMVPLKKQEVVKLSILQNEELPQNIEQKNTRVINPISNEANYTPAVEICISGATVRFYNDTNPELLKLTLECIGGDSHAW